MENKKERLMYLDVAKGIGILFVVIGHIYAFNKQIVDRFFVIWLYSFHMPLFFIISGMLIAYKNEKDILKFLIKRIKGILIPYVFFSFLSILIFAIMDDFDKASIIWNVKISVRGIGIDTLWFLPVLFFSEVIFFIMKYAIRNKYLICICSTIIYICGNYMLKDNGVLFLFFGRICIATGFIMLGNYSLNLINKTNVPYYCLILLFVFQVILSKINGFVDLNNLVLNNKVLYLINSLLGSYLIIEISKKILKSEELVYWGRNSLVVMATHLNIIYLFKKLWNIFWGGFCFEYITGLIIFIGLLVIEKMIIYVINNYIPFIIGKNKKTICKLMIRRGIKL